MTAEIVIGYHLECRRPVAALDFQELSNNNRYFYFGLLIIPEMRSTSGRNEKEGDDASARRVADRTASYWIPRLRSICCDSAETPPKPPLSLTGWLAWAGAPV